MRIDYVDGARLRRSLIAGCDHVQLARAELNRINVFPVPDGDTGTNLALTTTAISEALRASREAAVFRVAREAADAAILGARGNCGMILSHFLLGFSTAVEGRSRIDSSQFADALSGAVDHVYRSLERPVEGTIITVMREAAEEARAAATVDFAELLERVLERTRAALDRTRDLLPALRAAGVVDAGAKGFVHMVEGVVGLIRGDPFRHLASPPTWSETVPAAAAEYTAEAERYRFCTEALVRGDQLPHTTDVRVALRDLGDSLIVVRGSDALKVHIHTDDPDRVFKQLRGYGRLVTHKAEDMAAQHRAIARAASAHMSLVRRPVSLVTDSSCDLPIEIIRAHGIHVVPLTLVFGDDALRDGVDIDARGFVDRMRAGQKATTSQPPPAAFLEAYRRAAAEGEAVLGMFVGSALSGTFASAEAAARRVTEAPVTLLDSRGASLNLGLQVLRAAELAELGRDVPSITAEMRRIRDRSGVFFTVDVFDNLLASGRVGRGRARLAGILDIKPILWLDEAGRVLPLARVRGRSNVADRMLALLDQRVPHDAQALRFGLIHVGLPEVVEELSERLRGRWGDREIIAAPATPVLACHLGPGAWGLAYQWED